MPQTNSNTFTAYKRLYLPLRHLLETNVVQLALTNACACIDNLKGVAPLVGTFREHS